MTNKKLLLFGGSSFLLAVFCLLGDYVVFKWPLIQSKDRKLVKAVSDSLLHGIIAGWSSAHLLLWQPEPTLSVGVSSALVIISILIATGIDLDHFIEAKSWNLKVLLLQFWDPPSKVSADTHAH